MREPRPARAPRRASRVGLGWLLLLGGCSFQASCGGKLDADKLERNIVAKLAPETKLAVTASCPKDQKAEKDKAFTCDVTIEGVVGKVTITPTDGKGTVNWELTEGFVLSNVIEPSIQAKLLEAVGDGVTVDCGPRVRPSVPGQGFTCTARRGGEEAAVEVKITDKLGAIDWKLIPPSAPTEAPPTPPTEAPPTPPTD
ncbi:MAG: DUF4333 domain-containing protein [Kofleriaceae bacterium]|jgi:hypothetical protein|nr:DUF4333 domain-containing protein [Kofleriaceae bacterium]MBP9167080.1 DUF4333 domain-containing protein [Kofleriaceae bacterium]MBP9861931.1 DUF4333 domain-containing protein [Kofleriaceae bacterium]